jgi:hypothetical protein
MNIVSILPEAEAGAVGQVAELAGWAGIAGMEFHSYAENVSGDIL